MQLQYQYQYLNQQQQRDVIVKHLLSQERQRELQQYKLRQMQQQQQQQQQQFQLAQAKLSNAFPYPLQKTERNVLPSLGTLTSTNSFGNSQVQAISIPSLNQPQLHMDTLPSLSIVSQGGIGLGLNGLYGRQNMLGFPQQGQSQIMPVFYGR
jgi:hypothetical protein